MFLEQVNGLGVTGCSRALLANRISYWLGVTGPSYSIDSACSATLTAMENAYRAIRNGQCDAALVGSANLCLHPNISLQFIRLGKSPAETIVFYIIDKTVASRHAAVALLDFNYHFIAEIEVEEEQQRKRVLVRFQLLFYR